MPDFLIIGGQKCGTTSLYVYLNRHPQIIPASQKEIHFFDLNYAQGVDWYLSQFPVKTLANSSKGSNPPLTPPLRGGEYPIANSSKGSNPPLTPPLKGGEYPLGNSSKGSNPPLTPPLKGGEYPLGNSSKGSNPPLTPPFKGGEAILTGESSPYYLFHPWVPQRVKELFPNIKLIVLLRDPVERTWSHYHHEVRLGFETLPFEAAIDSEAERVATETEKLRSDPNYYSYNHQHYTYLSRGIYVNQLKAWMELFPREQFLILNSEQFYANPSATLTETLAFLGLKFCELGEYHRFNIGEYAPISGNLRQKLVKYFIPYNQQLYDYLQVHWNWSE